MGFRALKWGFLFTILSFRIQGVDVLPDCVGYYLFAVGLSRLRSYSPSFERAIPWAYILSVLSLFEIYHRPAANAAGLHVQNSLTVLASGGLWSFLSVVYSAIVWILNLVVIYRICMGTVDLATSTAHTEVAKLAERRWSNYLVFKIVTVLVPLVGFIVPLPPIIILLVVGGLIYAVIMVALMMGFMNEVNRTIA
ncbi:hypothetical protein [Alicyclobacillus ferrooxydans]|uniref:Uncharacterized protein n=1 Tax=Alicyclobacillus ferrooxydans TaxID=471514 RepID=A0A0P9D7I7_9BACL|nr:hypothetical protein [Alicyclobacillus ferrooxydans]KPV45278.1 hypothetical protein AN477_02545 [Alicyclobacillus ferrooxydans]